MAAPEKVGVEWIGEAWLGGGCIKGRVEVHGATFNSTTSQNSFL